MATLKDQIGSWSLGDWGKASPAHDLGHAQEDAISAHSASIPDEIDKFPEDENVQINSVHSESYYTLKADLHRKLLAEVNLSAIQDLSIDRVRDQLSQAINKLIDSDSIPVNELERTDLVGDLLNDIVGLGPLEPLLADSAISEIMVNRCDVIFVERKGRLEKVPVRFNDEAHLLKVIDKIVSRVGRRIDESSPMADARLADGSRVNAIIPPIALDGASLSIRRFAVIPLMMEDLIAKRALTSGMAEMLAGMVKAKLNILISGGTGSGKTTLLNILSSYIPANERIITIEDTAELQLQQSHVVRLETRPANIEGTGEISMRGLVKNSLRMRPDRIVLGEVRGGEVIDMLQAMNTGHDGSLTTVHANTPRDALGRLENLVGLGGVNMPAKALRQQIASAINVIVQAQRLSDGSRRIVSIHEVTGMEGEIITTQEIFYYERQGVNADGSVIGRFRSTGVRPKWADRLKTFGVNLREDLFDPSKLFD